ncbi:MAG: glycosyltransferase, partial [Candidatus Omnitrophica bacterium]|nr:glycosyltransferase [Candidatus Omnitrophota bacterium]
MDGIVRKINIVLLTDCLGDITGGAEKQIFELARRLPKTQYNVYIASMEAGPRTSASLIQSIDCQLKVFRVNRIYGLSGFFQGIKFLFFLRRHSIDVMMTYHFGSDIWGTFWGHLASVGTIISNRRDMGFWRHQFHVMVYRMINPWVHKIVAVTATVKQMIIEMEGVCADKIQVIYNGVDPAPSVLDSAQNREQLGLGAQDTVVMHVANLHPVKGHKYLIEAFARIAPRFPNAKLVLVGQDKLNGEMQNLVKHRGINYQVLFLGQRKDVPKLLALADIGVLPSLSEGMSNAILEYMAFGLAVIATNVGGNPELIEHGVNGLLVEKENIEQLSEALIRLLVDKTKREAYGKHSLLLVQEKFSMQAMLGAYRKLFERKVLHLVSSNGIFGAEQVMLNLAGFSEGVTPVIGALNNQHNSHLEIIDEARKRNIHTAVFESSGRIDLNTIKQIADFARQNSIDIIHTHNYKSNLIGGLAACLSRKKWVATVHGWTGTDAKLRLYEKIDALILKLTGHIICVSKPGYQQLLKRGLSSERLSVIPNGIDLEKFSRRLHNSRFKRDLNDTVIAIVGRLSPEKGHEVLLKAMAQVIKKCPNVKLLVVGDGPMRNELEEQIQNLNLSHHVILTGIINDMPDIYGICDILVNASYTEGLPMSILEAMACKVAVVATHVGAVPEVIESGKNGLLIE